MDQNLTPEQLDKALKLCDILGLDDLTVSTAILEQVNWSIDKAIEIMQDQVKQQASKKKKQQAAPVPSYYDQQDNEDEQEFNDHFQYDFQNPNEDFENKQRQFQEGFELNKLDRSTSEPPTHMEKRLSYDRHIIQDYANHRHSYQVQLLEDAQKFCKKILGEKAQEFREVDKSRLRNHQNRQFICELDRRYHTKINFTFGTFMLNLVRSYLDKKYLLVYIHCTQHQNSQSVKMILTQRQIANFINRNCVSYGMFDNSDDYQVIQRYVPMKDLPAFALFKYSKKTRAQKFISSYSIMQKKPQNFIQWLANSIGVPLKKKTEVKQEKKQQKSKIAEPVYTHRDIMRTQNQQYEQMERIWNLKRQESKLKKEQISKAEQMIIKLRQKFKQEPKLEQGKSIEIKFRLPESGKSLMRVFNLGSKVKEMFDYISCFGRDEFEQRYANFDLTQTFPRLSLHDQQQKHIKQIFEDSTHENIIVKQI